MCTSLQQLTLKAVTVTTNLFMTGSINFSASSLLSASYYQSLNLCTIRRRRISVALVWQSRHQWKLNFILSCWIESHQMRYYFSFVLFLVDNIMFNSPNNFLWTCDVFFYQNHADCFRILNRRRPVYIYFLSSRKHLKVVVAADMKLN